MPPEAIDSDAPPAEENGATGTVQPGTSAAGNASTADAAGSSSDASPVGSDAVGPVTGDSAPPAAAPVSAVAPVDPVAAVAPVAAASVAGVDSQAAAVNVLLGRTKTVDNSDKIAQIQAKIDELSRELEGLKTSTDSTLEKEEAAKHALKATLSPAEPVRLFATGVEGKVLAVYFDYSNERQVSILPINPVG